MPAILGLVPNRDPRVLEEDYVQLTRFLQNVARVREREEGNSNGEFFHIVAAQFMALASLQYLFGHPPGEIVETAKQGLADALLGLELGHRLDPAEALQYFSVALVANDRLSAHRLASAPEDSLGFSDDPDSPLPLLTGAAFAFLADQDAEVQPLLDLLHDILFHAPLDNSYQPMIAEMRNLYHVLASLQVGDDAEFNDRLLERGQITVDILNQEDTDTLSLIDWPALGVICFAHDRGLPIGVRHVCIPLRLIETTERLRRH